METKRTIQHDLKVIREVGVGCRRLIGSRIGGVHLFRIARLIRRTSIGYARIAFRLLSGRDSNGRRHAGLSSYRIRFGGRRIVRIAGTGEPVVPHNNRSHQQ